MGKMVWNIITEYLRAFSLQQASSTGYMENNSELSYFQVDEKKCFSWVIRKIPPVFGFIQFSFGVAWTF